MEITRILIGFGLGTVISLSLAALLWIHRRHRRRGFNDHGNKSILEDGQPGGRRGRVWSEKERAMYRRNRKLRKLRVIQ